MVAVRRMFLMLIIMHGRYGYKSFFVFAVLETMLVKGLGNNGMQGVEEMYRKRCIW